MVSLFQQAYLNNIDSKYKFNSSNTKTNEVLRAFLGESDDEVINTCHVLMQSVGIDDNSYTAEMVAAKESGVSGRFKAVKIIFNSPVDKYKIDQGDIMFMTNKTTIVSDKRLSPQKLGLTTHTKQNIITAVKKGLDSAEDIDINIRNILVFLCECINKDTAVDSLSVYDLIDKGNELKTLTYTIPNTYNIDLISNVKNRIENDFGEILGSIYLLNALKDASHIIYDSSVTTKMIDYVVEIVDSTTKEPIDVEISAKAAKAGKAPSSQEAFNRLAGFINGEAEIEGIGNFKQFMQLFGSDKKAEEILKMIAACVSESTRNGFIDFADYWCPEDVLSKFTKLFGYKSISSLKNIEDYQFAEKVNELCDDEVKFKEFQDFITYLYKRIQNKSNVDYSSPDTVRSILPASKIGMIISPLSYYGTEETNEYLASVVNNEAEKEPKPDILSSFLQLAFTYKQLYIKVSIIPKKSTINIAFSCAAMNKSKWEFRLSTSANQPWKQRIGISIKK